MDAFKFILRTRSGLIFGWGSVDLLKNNDLKSALVCLFIVVFVNFIYIFVVEHNTDKL